jgi:adenylate cyclase
LPAGILITALCLRAAERTLRRKIDGAVRQYLPDTLADSLVRGPLPPNTVQTSETRFAICLATDASGFTAVSENLPPEALHQLLNKYFEPLFEVTKRRGGLVANLTADALMCAWTADDPLHARSNAVLAALEMQDLVDRFNAKHPPSPLPTRFGLHAGLASFGAVGGAGHYEYRVFGDVPNTASRIETLNKHLHTRALASAEVLVGLKEVVVRPLGSFVFVGKSQPVAVAEILGRAGQDQRMTALAEAFAIGLSAYEKGDWSVAAECFYELQKAYPDDGPTSFYLDRALKFAKEPPPPGSESTIRMNAK